MNWNYFFLANLISAIGISVIHLTHNNVPWFITAILCLNLLLSTVSSLMLDEKDKQRDEKIKLLEKELDELRQKIK